jgi:hypothetical protein
LFEITALRHDDQVILVRDHFLRAGEAEICPEYRYKAIGQKISLPQYRATYSGPERIHDQSLGNSPNG